MTADITPWLDQWKWLPGFEGKYAVHRSGAVWNVQTQHILSASWSGNGYATVAIDGKSRHLHDVVLTAWAGPRPVGLVARHLNDRRGDNSIDNLAWGTQSENVHDAIRNGCRRLGPTRGEGNHNTKLTADQVRQVRAFHSYGFGYSEIGRWFGMTAGGIRNLVLRRTWGWLDA